ncbi:hypothetical protein, partial [Escherichia coli]|uniref:hypothetical protein n=1 Tax=Escherichia coli TaxID=562 RepID=UPI001BC850EB
RTDTIFTVKPWPILLDHYRPSSWCLQCRASTYRSGELILTHFSGESLAAHTNERRLTMGLHRGDRRAGTGGGL